MRRSRSIPSATAARLDEVALVAAVLVLARRYCDSDGAYIGVSRSGWEAPRLVGGVLPAERTVGEHLRLVGEDLRAGGEAGGTPEFVCLLGEAPVRPDGANLVISAIGGELRVDAHVHVHDIAFVDRMLGHLLTLLDGFTDPARTIGALRMLTEAEYAWLHDVNATTRDYPRAASIHELFAEQVAARPDHLAVRTADSALTYRELDERSGRLAAALVAAGIRPGDRVAFVLEKTPLLVVAALAILRVGAAYVPIDTGQPARRRDFLIADSGASLLLVDRPTTAPVPVLDVTADVTADHTGPAAPPVTVPSDAVAYVVHTSGSTGTPKGVPAKHRAVVRLVRDTDYAPLSQDSVILQTGAIGFDATTFEIWGALLNGGTVVLVPQTTVLTAVGLGATVRQFGVTTMFLTTLLFNQLVEQDATVFGDCFVLVGGERASVRHFAEALEACPGATFSNIYGPTENTTFSTVYRVTRPHRERIPIGRPIANSTAWVLDRDRNPQPLGVPGELYVGGDGLSDGYLGRPELTAHAFVSTTTPLYRTGDRVQWTNSGHLDHLGRLDDQVKVRGFRIEPAEVEHHLATLTRECVVLARDDALHAFFTSDTTLDPADLRTALRAELPDYLVPATFRQVDALPMSHNHKVDRHALLALAPAAPIGRPPTTELEMTVATLFAEVLGLPSVSLDDDFFALGGHSLRAMRLWNRIRTKLGVDIGLPRLLAAPTVADVVAAIGRVEPAADRPKLVRRS